MNERFMEEIINIDGKGMARLEGGNMELAKMRFFKAMN